MNNSVVLQGNLAEEVEVKTSASGKKYANALLSVETGNEAYPAKVFGVTVFGDVADQLGSYKQGTLLSIKGRVARNDFNDETSFEVIGNKCELAKEQGYKNFLRMSGFVQTKSESGMPELKKSKSGNSYLPLAISVKRDTGKRSEGEEEQKPVYDTFFLTSFGKTAEGIADKVHKGDLIELSGRLDIDENGKLTPIASNCKMLRERSAVQEGIDLIESEEKGKNRASAQENIN